MLRTGSDSRSERRISHGAQGTTWFIGRMPASTSRRIVVSLTSHWLAARALCRAARDRDRAAAADRGRARPLRAQTSLQGRLARGRVRAARVPRTPRDARAAAAIPARYLPRRARAGLEPPAGVRPRPQEGDEPCRLGPESGREGTDESPKGRRPARRYYRWAELLRRVFLLEVLVCLHCSGPRRILTCLVDPSVVRKILAHLGLPSEPPAVAPARPPPEFGPLFDVD